MVLGSNTLSQSFFLPPHWGLEGQGREKAQHFCWHKIRRRPQPLGDLPCPCAHCVHDTKLGPFNAEPQTRQTGLNGPRVQDYEGFVEGRGRWQLPPHQGGCRRGSACGEGQQLSPGWGSPGSSLLLEEGDQRLNSSAQSRHQNHFSPSLWFPNCGLQTPAGCELRSVEGREIRQDLYAPEQAQRSWGLCWKTLFRGPRTGINQNHSFIPKC